MKRTQDEIVARIRGVEPRDIFGFERGDLLEYLDWEHAKEFLNLDARAEDFKITDVEPAAKIERYLPFAWDKANNCRGISANRSMCHMAAWLWLDGHDRMADEVHDYNFYGKPHLVRISELYGVDWKELDDGEWVNNESDDPLSAEDVMGKSEN